MALTSCTCFGRIVFRELGMLFDDFGPHIPNSSGGASIHLNFRPIDATSFRDDGEQNTNEKFAL
jgi:hypothetical protein